MDASLGGRAGNRCAANDQFTIQKASNLPWSDPFNGLLKHETTSAVAANDKIALPDRTMVTKPRRRDSACWKL
jgi:hypothetical protein